MKKKISLILNSLIVIFELIAIFLSIKNNGRYPLEYYTDDSNLLALFSSLFFIYYLIRNKEIPKLIQLFKYTTTVALTLTFFVVLLVLSPMYNFNYIAMFTHQSMLYQHLLCPIISTIAFIYFDNINQVNKKDIFNSLLLTIIYAITLVILNILKIVEGPYPFLEIYNQPILLSIIWFTVILGMAYLISFILQKLKYKRQ